MKKIVTLSILSLSTLFYTSNCEAYTQKSPYEGYGQLSKVNGLPKTKSVSGYTKQTSKGSIRVNPYSRSKI